MGLSKEIEMILDALCLKAQKEIQNLFNRQRR
jgi:hypothetical protein